MLVLSRRLGETLIIGDDVKVTVLGISGNQVRLGIAAPKKSVYIEKKFIFAFKASKTNRSSIRLN